MKIENEKLLSNTDPILEKIILQVAKPYFVSTNDVFHDLMSCIIEQQIHYRSTKRIFAKALERAGIEHLSLDNFHLIEKHSLPQIKLAMGKYETIMSFIDYWSNNILDFNQLTDEEIISKLSSIKGIGKWTIDMILIYTLQRPNVFPYDDFHIKQVMISLYNLDPKVKLKAQMVEISEKWGNQKSLAVLYLLAWKQHNKSL
ncbi:MAG: DNA-3-methyladenine glycosylase family protein [Bacteroidia bacterium]